MSRIHTVNLPDIGEGVVEGEVIEWLKHPNDLLEQDEPVVIVMTDKATVELPAPYPGKLVKQYFKVGEISLRDKPLYAIEVSADKPLPASKDADINCEIPHIPSTLNTQLSAEHTDRPPGKASISTTLCPHVTSSHKVLASPATRKLANQMDIDIQHIKASHESRIISNSDLKAHYTSQKNNGLQTSLSNFPGDQERPLVGIHLLMAKKMVESKSQIPHFSYFEQVDATRLVQLKERIKEEASKEEISVTYMPFIIRALSKAIERYPEANSSLDLINNRLILHKEQHIGVAMSTPRGLIVPVLRHVEKMSLQEIIRAFHQLKIHALTGKLPSSEMKGSTITISNFGVLEGKGLWATPIINYPEVAILAIARIQKEPVVRNGAIVIRDMLNLSWSFDHRVMDGEFAAKFSHCFACYLQNPATLL